MPTRLKRYQITSQEGSLVAEFNMYPSADQLVNRWISKGVTRNTIDAGGDEHLCSAAIIASAMVVAEQRHSKTISASDVWRGWNDILAFDLCVPPWRCLARSVTQRLDHVRTQLPAFEQILEQIKPR